MKNLEKMINDLDEEIIRVKMFCNENGYHHGTSIFQIVHRYRNELKQLNKLICDDFFIDKIENYSECENNIELKGNRE